MNGQCEVRRFSLLDDGSCLAYRLLAPPTASAWDLIVPGRFAAGDLDAILLYERETGRTVLQRTDGYGAFTAVPPRMGIGKGWNVILPGHFSASPRDGLLCYNREEGFIEFFELVPGEGYVSRRRLPWSKACGHLGTGRFGRGGYRDVVMTDGALLRFYETDGEGRLRELWHTQLSHACTAVVPLDFSPTSYTDLICYDRDAGKGYLYADEGTRLRLLSTQEYWGKHLECILPGNFSGAGLPEIFMLSCPPTAPRAAYLRSVTPEGNVVPRELNTVADWRWRASLIVPGSLAADSTGAHLTGLLFYDRERVLIDNSHLKRRFEQVFGERLVSQFYLRGEDGTYFCGRRDYIDRVVAGFMDRHRWDRASEKMDCDDYALLLKAAFVEDAWHDLVRAEPTAAGMIAGNHMTSPSGFGSHMLNFAIADDWKFWLIEPQTGRIFEPSVNDSEVDFAYV